MSGLITSYRCGCANKNNFMEYGSGMSRYAEQHYKQMLLCISQLSGADEYVS